MSDLLQNHMSTHKKFEINRTKIKGGCQSGGKVVTHNSKSDLPLIKVNCQSGAIWFVDPGST